MCGVTLVTHSQKSWSEGSRPGQISSETYLNLESDDQYYYDEAFRRFVEDVEAV